MVSEFTKELCAFLDAGPDDPSLAGNRNTPQNSMAPNGGIGGVGRSAQAEQRQESGEPLAISAGRGPGGQPAAAAQATQAARREAVRPPSPRPPPQYGISGRSGFQGILSRLRPNLRSPSIPPEVQRSGSGPSANLQASQYGTIITPHQRQSTEDRTIKGAGDSVDKRKEAAETRTSKPPPASLGTHSSSLFRWPF